MKPPLTSALVVRTCVCTTLVLVLLFSSLAIFAPLYFHPLPGNHTTTTTPAFPDASPTAVVYNISNSWRALHFCKSAYCPVDAVVNWSCGSACGNATTDFHVFNVYENASTGNSGFSGMDHEAGKIVVAFRGTANTANWIQDLDFWSMPYPHPACGELCAIHRGFYKAYDSMREQLLQDVLAMHAQYPTYSLFITGHSLGGAIAVLSAIEFTTWNLPRTHSPLADNLSVSAAVPTGVTAADDPAHLMPVELYTFGEPRVGNVYFTNWSTSVLSQERQFRVTHARDPVPHLPPRSWGYLHVPQEHWYPADDSVYMRCADRSDAEDPACSNSVYSTTVSDHLLYLGTCTRCSCNAATMEEIYNYTLSPEVEALLATEYLIDHTPPAAVHSR
ncbi:putative lipase [Leptomonas pyrrhocoris]|uniref:Putative lipase n=1 Tax=Leptomonas pyrrhocoris TaxID=157538 RepID=A0A0M9FRD3_LEPPY|nr:putative lipase [Leptomonas pyrrhocoris]KPA74447.1 putative lipase [Leptomonas pyrrhocoris]|eukprot:XP_015652886.1 putative lipase [Leptomonas pyrrhocoris]